MNVANLDLCKELYELSGWGDTTWNWYCDEERDDTPVMNLREFLKVAGGVGYFDHAYPAYDLGYLLRKLPTGTMLTSSSLPEFDNPVWTAEYDTDSESGVSCDGATPESAAAQLCIELIKQKVLTPAGEREL